MPSRTRSYVLLAIGTAVTLTFGLHGASPALPLVQEEFGLSDFQVGMVTSAYVLPGVAFAIPLGMLADLIGRRRVFVGASALYGVTGIAQGFAPTFAALLSWRLGQGLAFAALMPLTVTLIGDALTGLAQVRAQAQRQVSMAAASLVVPVLGAQLAAVTWSLPFAFQSITVIPGLFALFVLDRGGTRRAIRGTGYLGNAVGSIRRPGFPSILTVGFLRFFARFGILGFLPVHLTRALGMSLPMVGVVMGVATGLGFASAMIADRVSSRVRPSRIVFGSLIGVGVALIGFAMPVNLGVVLGVAVVYALADGLIAVLQSAYAAGGTPDDVRAGVVAVNGTARNAGKFLGPIVVGAVASAWSIGGALVVTGTVVIVAAFAVSQRLAGLDGLLTETGPQGHRSDPQVDGYAIQPNRNKEKP
jgi:MFS transporter, ACDE family, multidrug resistance protein